MSYMLDKARELVSKGYSVIPVKADGSKSPAVTGWRKYATEPADEATLRKWFGDPKAAVGVGVAAGPASGNLVVLDFEHDGKESAYVQWLQRLPANLRAVAEKLPTVTTPSGGRHVWVRLPEPQPGGKLARYAGGKTKIEIRGDGHQVLAPGCPAECHPSGKLYEWAGTPEFDALDADTFAELCEHAAACNDYSAPEQPRDADRGPGCPAGEDSPGNDFNRRGTWAEAGLFDAGWAWHRKVGDERGFLTRPGKAEGVSASIGMVSGRQHGHPYLYVWSTSTDFPAETPLSRFAVYAALKHKGDYSAAAKELQRLGYGERPGFSDYRKAAVDLSEFRFAGKAVGAPAADSGDAPKGPADDKPFRWMSELDAQGEAAKWVWTGYLARGGITLLSALWKSGKSTLLSHLLKALDGSRADFLGRPVVPARVLYVTEEHESIWADRRDALLIGDHVGMWCRPFKTRPTMADWREHVRVLAEQVRKHKFDVVVFDTLSKMWPVREENDAGQVEEALMPLWSLAQEDVAILLVHHTRKSGGEQFVAARGSGGLSAFCEILIEFGPTTGNPKETKRLLTGKGRYAETPVKWLAELTPAGYVGHGDPDDSEVKAAVKRFDWEDDLTAVLIAANGEWLTFDDLNSATAERRGVKEIRKADMLAVLGKWLAGGEIERQGEGRKGDPYEYRVVTM